MGAIQERGDALAPAPAQVKVRVQARDGKVLGPAKTVKQPLLSVRNVLTGKELITGKGFDTRSSGVVVQASAFSETVSRNAIVVEPPPLKPPPPVDPPFPKPGPYWLETPIGQGELIVSLPLTEPSLLEFTATAYAPAGVYASATMWVMPGMQLLADPGLVLTIAGLYTTVQTSVVGGTVDVTATVTMMCGCPITVAPPQSPPSDERAFLAVDRVRGMGNIPRRRHPERDSPAAAELRDHEHVHRLGAARAWDL